MAITQGDTNGIGYELIFKTFAEPEMLELCTPIIYGSPKVATYHRKALNLPGVFTIIEKAEDAHDGKVNMLPAFDEDIKVTIGEASNDAGHAALMALDRAITDFKDNLFDVLVTAPFNAVNIPNERLEFTTQSNYIRECFHEAKDTMVILQNKTLRVGLMTDKMALKQALPEIKKGHIVDKAKLFLESLRRDFRIPNPRIAVLSLNPEPGKEEQEIISPAIEELAEKNINAFGPYATDDFFGNAMYEHFDGVLAMYYDQGVAPFRAMMPCTGVKVLTGLPLMCTAPNQGVSYDIAGKGEADESAFRDALYLAIDAYRNRLQYDEPMANPLPKLYRERRDESEKARFAAPKKRAADDKEHSEQQAE